MRRHHPCKIEKTANVGVKTSLDPAKALALQWDLSI